MDWYITLMMNRYFYVHILLIALLLAVNPVPAQTFPEPLGYISDYGNVTTAAEREHINAICRELQAKTSAQIAVAVFPDLGDEEYTDYAVRLFEHWGIGQRGKDNGVLILNALAERKVRIEVGYGLEGLIPDGLSGRILRQRMFPLLKEGKHGAAYLSGVAIIASIIAKDAGVTLSSLEGVQIPRPKSQSRRPFPIWLFLPFFLIPLMRSRRRRSGLFPFFLGAMMGGGGFGGGSSFGGGGFGGFGGGMSGGGGAGGGY